MAVKPLAFSFEEVRRFIEAEPAPTQTREQLWIAARHSAMALHALDPSAHRDRRPTVAVESLGRRLRVVALNEAARSRGVHAGLDLNAAFAFSGALRVLERSPRAERRLLEAAAAIGHRFTPTVSLEPPECVLLEVRASLVLFGGLERLKALLDEALGGCIPGFRLSTAPTPLAALWLARGDGDGEGESRAEGASRAEGEGRAGSRGRAEGEGRVGSRGRAESEGRAGSRGRTESEGRAGSRGRTEGEGGAGSGGAESEGGAEGEADLASETLSARLAPLPLSVTRWPARILERLEGMGIETIGDCLRLPRDGFARRAGKACLEELDKALGKRADLRAGFEMPQHLGFEVELLDESTNVSVFVEAVARMLELLSEALRERQLQVKHLRLVFKHARLAPTVHRLELLDSTSDRNRLLELLRDKLERITLPAPATALRLAAGPLEPAVLEAGRLFKGEGGRSDTEAEARLIERLRGRLGEPAVHGVAPAADHRPERAWVEMDASEVLRARAQARQRGGEALMPGPGVPDPAERPLWLAPAPERLRCAGGKPCLGSGALRVLDGPERIETGWWEGRSISRDYYIALGPSGERLWIFRDRTDRCWYLHGRFG